MKSVLLDWNAEKKNERIKNQPQKKQIRDFFFFFMKGQFQRLELNHRSRYSYGNQSH